jgi:putative ABC transport system permease protein
MALGAEPGHVISVVLRHLSLPVAAGFVLGVGGAVALSQLLRGQLYGISHLDAASYLTAIGVFAVTIFLAAWLPARRALRIDPLAALRHE